MTAQDEFAFKVMDWLNDTEAAGATFETKWGILRVWWSHGWEFEYLHPSPLPESLKEGG